MRRQFIKDEDKVIIENYGKLTYLEIGRLIGRTAAATKYRAIILSKKRLILLRHRLKNRLKIDEEEFKKVWLSDMHTDEVAKHFNLNCDYVRLLGRRIGLKRPKTSRRLRPTTITREKLVEKIKKAGGRLQFLKNFHYQILREGFIVVEFNLKSPHFGSPYSRPGMIFNKKYVSKGFVVTNRTELVRLMMHGLKKIKNTHQRRSVSNFLNNNHLTEAERCAVLLKLGAVKWDKSSVRNSVQVDGTLMPRGKWKREKMPGWHQQISAQRGKNNSSRGEYNYHKLSVKEECQMNKKLKEKKAKYPCPICLKNYSSSPGMGRHCRRKHHISPEEALLSV